MRTLLASLRTMSIPSHQAAIGVARPGIPNTVTNTNTAFIMISLSEVSYQTNHHHQSHHHDHHHFMMNISEIYQKHFHINMFVSSQFSCWHYGFKCACTQYQGHSAKAFVFRNQTVSSASRSVSQTKSAESQTGHIHLAVLVL